MQFVGKKNKCRKQISVNSVHSVREKYNSVRKKIPYFPYTSSIPHHRRTIPSSNLQARKPPTFSLFQAYQSPQNIQCEKSHQHKNTPIQIILYFSQNYPYKSEKHQNSINKTMPKTTFLSRKHKPHFKLSTYYFIVY